MQDTLSEWNIMEKLCKVMAFLLMLPKRRTRFGKRF